MNRFYHRPIDDTTWTFEMNRFYHRPIDDTTWTETKSRHVHTRSVARGTFDHVGIVKLFSRLKPDVSTVQLKCIFNWWKSVLVQVLVYFKESLCWEINSQMRARTRLGTGWLQILKKREWWPGKFWAKSDTRQPVRKGLQDALPTGLPSLMFWLILPHQKVNHFPGTFQIGSKDRLWRNLQKIAARYGREE